MFIDCERRCQWRLTRYSAGERGGSGGCDDVVVVVVAAVVVVVVVALVMVIGCGAVLGRIAEYSVILLRVK